MTKDQTNELLNAIRQLNERLDDINERLDDIEYHFDERLNVIDSYLDYLTEKALPGIESDISECERNVKEAVFEIREDTESILELSSEMHGRMFAKEIEAKEAETHRILEFVKNPPKGFFTEENLRYKLPEIVEEISREEREKRGLPV
jgi:uncharacterized coiled-coil DUF342 family protein